MVQHDIVAETAKAYDYIRSRSFKQIEFEFTTANDKAIMVDLNLQLYSWVIENLVKNAIDAMGGKGRLEIEVMRDSNYAVITVSDTGKGIPKRLHKKVFEPGYTTKKRGWGLGLSLTKRIIESYHKGRIFVKRSEIGKGTTFMIQMRLSEG